MAYVKLYCKKSRERSDGSAPLYLVLRIGSKEKLISTGKYIHKDQFDNARERTGNNKLQAFLNAEKAKLDDIILDLEKEGRAVTFANVLNRYKLGSNISFVDFVLQELGQLQVKKNTKRDYLDSLEVVKKYEPDVLLKQIDLEWLRRFEQWLTYTTGRGINSRAHDFVMIRRFVNIALEKKLIKEYPFKNFKIRKEKSDIEYLLEPDLQKLIALYDKRELSTRLQRVLGNFIFTCITGIAGDDMRNKDRLQLMGNKLSFKRGKTGAPITIPLSSTALRIYEDIKDANLKKDINRVNNDLREIMQHKDVKINKNITYHCGRHTFAVISLLKGIPLVVIQKVLGHSTITTTEIYAKVVDDLVEREMKKWEL